MNYPLEDFSELTRLKALRKVIKALSNLVNDISFVNLVSAWWHVYFSKIYGKFAKNEEGASYYKFVLSVIKKYFYSVGVVSPQNEHFA